MFGNGEEIHARAVKSALREFEAFASTRVRIDGAQSDRLTKNFATALFTHDTSRALDPHLHTHCIVFNATFDSVENRWKALQNFGLLRARKFVENLYYHELSRELRGFGYQIRNRARGDFEIEGVSEELCGRFSKRDREVDEALAKLLADKPELAGANLKDLRERLATEKRTRKQKDLSRDELRVLWESQLTKDELASIHRLSESSKKTSLIKIRLKSMRRCNGRKNICLIGIPSCWNAKYGSRHWNGRVVKTSQLMNSKNSRTCEIISAMMSDRAK